MVAINEKIKEYKEYTRLIEEAEAIKKAIAAEIKSMMEQEGKETMVVGPYKITYKSSHRTDLDRAKLEAAYGDMSPFEKIITYKQLRIS